MQCPNRVTRGGDQIPVPTNSSGFPVSLQVFHQISREVATVGFFQSDLTNFVIFEMSN